MTHRAYHLSLFGMFTAMAVACSPDAGTTLDPPPASQSVSPNVVISELMYHPVDEAALVDNHEFIEIYNRTDSQVDLSGWKLGGGVQYTFPAGASIPARAYRVIAKNKAALASIPSYMLDQGELYGDYAGELDNGHGIVKLLDAASATVDAVEYSDEFPWPIGADALGAGNDWLEALPNPINRVLYQYRGRSLERVSSDLPASEIPNWVPSPLEGPSPGRANSRQGVPPTIVLTKRLTWSGTDVLIRNSDTVKISVSFSPFAEFRTPQLQYFIDNTELIDEPTTTLDLIPNNGTYEATIPPQPDNSIIRYRILVDSGNGPKVVSPRNSDPFPYWAYFITPRVNTTSTTYHMFIRRQDWNQLYDNINFPTDDRRVAPGGSPSSRCMIRQSFDDVVPAVFVSNGVVYDTFARYQGSRWQRPNGVPLDVTKTSINPLPSRPSPPKVLSWKLNFPDYSPFEDKRSKLVLSKLNQSCPGLSDTLGEQLYGDPSIGIPAQRTRYARLHINGGYYHYMLDLEHVDSDMMKRYLGPGELLGDLYKADGNAGPDNVEGPWSTADERVMSANPDCPMWSIDDRYAFTYERVNRSWASPAAIRTMIETFNALRAAAVATGDYTALRNYFLTNWDYQKLLDYIAIRNWAEPWDDTVHNHFLYQRSSDGKWLLIPADRDLEFGEVFGWGSGKSFFIGEEGNPDNNGGLWNRLKDAFIKAYRAELWNRIVELDNKGVLSPASYKYKVDLAATKFSMADYITSPSSVCDFNAELDKLRSFGECRHQDVLAGIASAACTSSTCGLKGQYYQTMNNDASRDFAKAALKLMRTDASVDYKWGSSSPAAGLPADGFQIRWTGKVVPRYTEQYTFYTQTNDGVRLWVNGALLVNKWVDQSGTEWSGTINLIAGVPVPITMEYYDGTGDASAKLMWSSATQCKQTIPTTSLSPM